MGTVQEYQPCEKCKGVAVSIFNYKSSEENLYCQRCGHTELVQLIRDEAGNPVLTSDNKLQLEHKVLPGFGVSSISRKAELGHTICTHHQAVTEEQVDEFMKLLEDDAYDLEHTFMIIYQEGNIKILSKQQPPVLNTSDFEKQNIY